MNRVVFCFCIGGFICVSGSLRAQQVPTTLAKGEARHGRIEQTFENGRNIVRFFDKDGKKVKDIDLAQKETKIRISKGKVFDAGHLAVKISSGVAEAIEDLRKDSGRDVELYRQESKEAFISGTTRFVVVEEGYLDFVDYADANDSERLEDAAEVGRVTMVYDLDGKKILELSKAEGCQPIVSNTGQFFVVTLREYGKRRIVNRQKEILAEIQSDSGDVIFSVNDRFVILTELTSVSDKCAVSVFDTQSNKLELNISSLNVCGGDTNKIEILEDKKEIIVRHKWDVKTQRWLISPTIERIKF